MNRHMEPLETDILFGNLHLEQVLSDENNGTLTLIAAFDGKEPAIITYRDMYCSQFEEDEEGFIIFSVEEVALQKLHLPEYESVVQTLRTKWGFDSSFLAYMHRRGNKLYLHRTEKGEYIVFAKSLWISRKMEA